MARIPRLKAVSSADEIRPVKRVPELVRVPADKPLVGVILCNAPFHMPTHFDGTHTVLCAGDGECEQCAHRALRNYYLVALLDRNSSTVSWVQLSDHACTALLRQIREMERSFFGTVVKIGRERKHMQAPITVAVDQWATVTGRLPKPIDPQETLERVFNSPKVTGKHGPKQV